MKVIHFFEENPDVSFIYNHDICLKIISIKCFVLGFQQKLKKSFISYGFFFKERFTMAIFLKFQTELKKKKK